MSIHLAEHHPSLTLSSHLDEALKSYFPNSPLSYFQYLKIHQDGAMSLLTNRPDWISCAMKRPERKVYSCANVEYLDKDNYWFLWDHNLPDAPLALAREYDIANGICFVERHQQHYYLTAFATSTKCQNAIDFYINKVPDFKNFITYFRNSNDALLSELDAHKINLSEKDQDPNTKTLLMNDNSPRFRFPVHFRGRKSYITAQELACIQKLPLGKTAKQIAIELKMSPRTVESYFKRVMLRTGCQHKCDLIELLTS